ncbi:hypothetical protein BS50DRAFT_204727 [Corynespora cassiicola Philippines]|uniref:Uncharacterized protein n=1 Tax=Corynespora cassiicola Philippines TaxID=1448308 RepID=A0A2T2N5T6_CORCC|nr:hypothetical protein BS50DRAFT_204727 [Corynespora cassiicola Philippines]
MKPLQPNPLMYLTMCSEGGTARPASTASWECAGAPAFHFTGSEGDATKRADRTVRTSFVHANGIERARLFSPSEGLVLQRLTWSELGFQSALPWLKLSPKEERPKRRVTRARIRLDCNASKNEDYGKQYGSLEMPSSFYISPSATLVACQVRGIAADGHAPMLPGLSRF